MAQAKKQRPEALATFAEAARGKGKKPDDLGLVANAKTAPIPTDSKMKDEAATRVLQEGVTGEDRKSDEMIDRLPDRIVESRTGAHSEAASIDDESDEMRVPNLATAGPPTTKQGDSEEELGEDYRPGGDKMGP